MTEDLYRRSEAIFNDLVDLPESERERVLAERCEGHDDLRAAVQSLLRHDAAAAPLERGPVAQLIEQMEASPQVGERIGPYRLLEVLGEGGMGVVYLAKQDPPLERRVALKLIKLGMDTKEMLARFEAERQALALMNHPNIARVHDAGASPQGRPYFVMELVQGIPITEFCDQSRLTTRERLELFIPVCEAVQHAHQKGVIHRDLKPSNILAAQLDGRRVPKIIDFGVAKAAGQRLTERSLFTQLGQIIGTPAYMSPEQAETSVLDIDTRTDVYSLGVILYELLAGQLPLDPTTLRQRSGSEIQRLILESDPEKPSMRVATGPDSEVAAKLRRSDRRTLARRLRGDLDWIVMRCLEKDRDRRYESAAQLADDLGRHLRDEPVLAGAPSIGYRLTKFLRRNRGTVLLSAAVVAALLVGVGTGTSGAVVAGSVVLVLLLVGLGVSTALLRGAREARRGEARQRELAEQQRQLAEEARELARLQQRVAEERLSEVLRLSDVKRIAEMTEEERGLWPPRPEKVTALGEWLERARELASRLPEHRRSLELLRRDALPHHGTDARRELETHPRFLDRTQKKSRLEVVSKTIAKLEAQLADTAEIPSAAENAKVANSHVPHVVTREEKDIHLRALLGQSNRLKEGIAHLDVIVRQRHTWKFADADLQWRHDVSSELVQALTELTDDDPKTGGIASVEARLEVAANIEARSMTSAEASAAWDAAIADVARLPIYDGMNLQPQLGLLPLRRDPRSGLWEFWHMASGARPRPDDDPTAVSPWVIEENSGMALVLIPGGTFTLGAQSEDPEGKNYDPNAIVNEGPLTELTLDPIFLSRTIMTQGQWLVVTGENPSQYGPERYNAGKQCDLRHPVEQVSWEDCKDVLGRLDLEMPTEAQWEYAARAGTSTPWWTGVEKQTLDGAANIADLFAKYNGGPASWLYEDWLDDGYQFHSPVGMFRANPFGLHDIHGNVWEFCRDAYGDYDKHEFAPGDGELLVPGERRRTGRGGAFGVTAVQSRISCRSGTTSTFRLSFIGVRPARRVENDHPVEPRSVTIAP